MTATAHVDEAVHGRVVEVNLHGRLSRDDYETFVPDIESVIRTHGKVRILVTMHEFLGWDAGALWEDLKWNAMHLDQVERLAIVGEPTWHRWMTGLCRPFTDLEVRYYTADQLPEARYWLAEE